MFPFNREGKFFMWLILFMHALFGAAIPISKMLLTYTTPIFFTSLRMLIAGSILSFAAYMTGITKKISRHNQSWLLLAQIIFLGFYATYILRFWGLSYIPAYKAAFFFNASPFITALYSYILDKERLNKMQWLGLIIGFIGIIPILITSTPQEKSLGELFIFSWAELSVLLSVALHCYGWILMRKICKNDNQSPVFINAIALTAGGILALGTAATSETITYIPNFSSFFSWLIILIILNNLISHNIYAYLLQHHYSPTFLSFTNFLSPIFSALYGWILLNETITWHFACSTFIVFVGLYIFYREELSIKETTTANSF